MRPAALGLSVALALSGLALSGRASAQTPPVVAPWAPPPMPPPPPPTPDYAAAPVPPPRIAPAEPAEPLVRISAGATYRRLFSGTVAGFDLLLSIGTSIRADAVLTVGETLSGRDVIGARLGVSFVHSFGRFRLGAGLHAVYFNVQRVTTSNSTNMMAVGPFVLAQFDVAKWDGNSIFVGLRGGVDFVPNPYGGAQFELGFGR